MPRLTLAELTSRMPLGDSDPNTGWFARRRMTLDRGIAAGALALALVSVAWTWQVNDQLARSAQPAAPASDSPSDSDGGAYQHASFLPAWFSSSPATPPKAPAQNVPAGSQPQVTAGFGAPLTLTIPTTGGQWISPAPLPKSGFIVVWAKLKNGTAATATGWISKDKRTWTQVMRQSANANRSMPYVNLVLPVPEGYFFRFQLTGGQGQGLEIIEERGGLWFPLIH